MPPKLHLLHPEFPAVKLIVVMADGWLARLLLKYGYELIDEGRSDELVKRYPRKEFEDASYTDSIGFGSYGQPGQLREREAHSSY
jgi:hypothetical protein